MNAFLAVSAPEPGGVFVVDGWAPDYALEIAMQKFKASASQRLYVVGGPLTVGGPLSEYKTYAEFGAAILLRMGMSRTAVQAIPTPYVRKDRTYASAESLKIWMREHGGIPKVINLITVGVHARRSRLLYQQVFGDNAHIGIVAVEDRNYDPSHWWQSSQGFRSVTDETIAYSYARFFFYPPR